LIRDQKDYDRHCDYIHYNPVKHGFVKSPLQWKYSSFSKFVKLGYYEKTWGTNLDSKITEMDLE
jgi:putative transposase